MSGYHEDQGGHNGGLACLEHHYDHLDRHDIQTRQYTIMTTLRDRIMSVFCDLFCHISHCFILACNMHVLNCRVNGDTLTI